MLQLGPLPQHTISGGFGGGAWLVGLAGGCAKGLVVVWAKVEINAVENSRIMIRRVKVNPIEPPRKRDGPLASAAAPRV
jgi:hypothetical protein